MRLTTASKTISLLGYAGLTPFLLACLLALLGMQDLSRTLFIAYGAVILSFLGGALWGRVISTPQEDGARLGIAALVGSNVFALLAFAALLLQRLGLLLPLLLPLFLLAVGFLAVNVAEIILRDSLAAVPTATHPRYAALRIFLTTAVLVLHGLFYFLSVEN
jgi:hypothetical protein